MLDTAEKELPAAKQAIEDFESTLDVAEFKAATDAYNVAYQNSLNPLNVFKSLKTVSDSKLDAMRAAFNDYEAFQGLEESYKQNLAQDTKNYTDLEFAQSRDPSESQRLELIVLNRRIEVSQAKYDQVVLDTAKAKAVYDAAGDAYLAANKDR